MTNSKQANAAANVQDIYALTPLQEGLLFHSLRDPGMGVYCVQSVWELRGAVSKSACEAALCDVTKAHSVLRTAFSWQHGGHPVQVVLKDVDVPFSFDDWQLLDANARVDRFQETLLADRGQDFDLSRAPLTRLKLIAWGPGSYRIIWTYHHILLDGWSWATVARDFLRALEARLQSRNPKLQQSTAFRNYVSWIGEQDVPEAKRKWQQELEELTGPTYLATRPENNADIDSAAMHEVRLKWNPSEYADLRDYTKHERVTLSTTVQVAWAQVLARYTGETDVVFGATTVNRPADLADSDKMVGLFINTLPVRIRDISPETATPEAVRNFQRNQAALRRQCFVSLADITPLSNADAPDGMFNSILVFENYPSDELIGKYGDYLEAVGFQFFDKTNYPLTLVVIPGDTLEVRARYNPQYHNMADVDVLLESLKLATLRLAGADEAVAQTDRFSTMRVVAPAPPTITSIHEIFRLNAKNLPDNTAVSFEGEAISYRELDQQSDQIAYRLIESGVCPRDFVGVCLDRSVEMVLALLAILKAGAVYVPLDPKYPADRVLYSLNDCGCASVVTSRHECTVVDGSNAQILLIEELAGGNEHDPGEVAETLGEIRLSGEDLAYVIYTSGSTGNPKGVMVTHSNVARLFCATEQWFGFGPNDVWTLFHSYAFDFSVWEMWGALLHGGRLVVVPYWTARDPGEFLDLIRSESVTVLNQTPSAFKQLIKADGQSGSDVTELQLRFVIFGGEALDFASLRAWLDRHEIDSPSLINMYGITETTVHVTWHRISEDEILQSRGSNIGIPIPDLEIYLLDKDMKPVGFGVLGEIVVGGAGVSAGYLNRVELTAEKFIDDPLNPASGRKFYRSGDTARRRPDGTLEYVGRIDNQLKIRGFRIEPGEIEAAICQLPNIKDCAVIAQSDDTGHQRLVGYIIPVAGELFDANDLRSVLAETLPPHCVPEVFIALAEFKLTANGKLDYDALPSPTNMVTEHTGVIQGPEGPVEAALAKVWCDVLGLQSLDVTHSFFNLGGDSILSIRAVSKLRREGYRITPKQLFENPSIRRLARLAVNESEAVAARNIVPGGLLDLTPIQKWFFELGLDNSNHWNMAFSFELSASVSAEQLGAAIKSAADRHSAFRLRFSCEQDVWKQHYVQESAYAFSVVDLPANGMKSSQDLRDEATSAAHRSLNIVDGPLANFLVFRAPQSGVLTLVAIVHHLVVDGVSWQILLEDIDAFLAVGHIEAEVLQPTTPFGIWPEALAAFAKTADCEKEFEYWRSTSMASQNNTGNIPVDFEDTGDNLERDSITHSVSFSSEDTDLLLRQVPSYFRASANEVLLAVLSKSLCTWAGCKQVTVDLEGHGRETLADGVDLTRSIGWFTTIFPFVLNSNANDAIETVVQNVKSQLRMVPRKGIGYGLLRHGFVDQSGSGLHAESGADIIFNFLGDLDQITSSLQKFRFSEVPTGAWRDPGSSRSHLLEVNAFVQDGCLKVWWTHNKTKHAPETIARVGREFEEIATDLVRRSLGGKSAAYSPSDFPLAAIPQSDLETLGSALSDIENVYAVSPIQALHLSLADSSPETGIDLWYLKLHGALDVARLKLAWKSVFAQHELLRSSFAHRDVSKPYVLIHEDIDIPIDTQDWTKKSTMEIDRDLAALVKAQRSAGFDLQQAPLTRLTLLRTSEEDWTLVWMNHHLQLDGWSWPIVLSDVGKAYQRPTRDEEVRVTNLAQYSSFIEVLQGTDRLRDAKFWRRMLGSFVVPSALPGAKSSVRTPGSSIPKNLDAKVVFSIAESNSLRDLACENEVTLTTLLFAAWSIVLAEINAKPDIVFGAAFSGRPAELNDVEHIVGPFVNDLPIRVNVESAATLADFLKTLSVLQFELTEYQHTPLEQIQECSGVPWRYRLFESLMVVQNYVTGETANVFGEDLEMADMVGSMRTNYPLTIVATPGESIEVTFTAHENSIDKVGCELIASTFRDLLLALLTAGHQALGALSPLVPETLKTTGEDPASLRGRVERSLQVASTETERLLLELWHDEFDIPEIGVENSWADFGIQSALILKFHKRMGEKFQRSLSIAKMYEHPTVRALANYLDEGDDVQSLSAIETRAQRARSAARRTARKRTGRAK